MDLEPGKRSVRASELIRQAQEAELLRFTTAGSVDDGKSTLIGRLLHDARGIYEDHLLAVREASARSGQKEIDWALLTDGLKAEREQRITIDVAYRHFSTPRRRFIIADTPGHEQYTRNMATGASTANLAVILIDARNGVVIQSKRHGFIASLLGIPHLVVAVNKMDLVDYSREVFERIRDEYVRFTTKLRIRDVTFIPISALHGDNIVHRSTHMPWYQGPPLLTYLETVHIASDGNLIDFRFPVQYVLRPNADFRGYCGTITSGVVRVGDEVAVLPSGKRTRISRILGPNGDTTYAFAPQSITVCLEDAIDVSRGDMLAHPGNLPWMVQDLEAILIWMDNRALRPGQSYLVKHTTNVVRGECVGLKYRIDPNTLHRQEAATLELNEIGRVHLRMHRPLLCDEYERNRGTGSFILIDPVTHFTAAAGLVIDRCHTHGAVRVSTAAPKKATNVTRHEGRVTPEQRAALLRQRPATLWLTGLSGSGKSTLAYALEERLVAAGHACVVLDGDNVRHGLNRDLGFSAQDRSENIRRVAEVARLFNEAGLIVITSFISPYREDRQMAREIIGGANFIEAFVDAPLQECERRDPKGLYAKARAGQIPEFTGISAPYEAPEAPGLRLESARYSVAELVEQVYQALEARGCFRPESGEDEK
ncbi:MAG: sulfate adenylyltransferase subunit CysN [Armatimonadetes bacterium]|nr:sulfate adenylyltransferase subunit CysN [Armatimonadota bacterium]